MTGVLLTPLTSGATTPSQSALASGTTSVDLRARVSRANWADTTNLGAFIANWSSTVANCRWIFKAGSGGTLVVQWYNASGALQTATSTVPVGLTAGTIKWVRAVIQPVGGSCQFFTSDDDVTYTQLGLPVTGLSSTAMQTPTTSQVISVGQDASAANGMLQHVYRTKILINSVQLLNMDWTAQTAPTGTWTSGTGEVWTRAGLSFVQMEDTGLVTFSVTSADPGSKIADTGTSTLAINATIVPGVPSPALDMTGYQDLITAGNVRANRMIDALPPFYRSDPTVRAYISVNARELDRIEAAAVALRTGSFPATASERTLELYEGLYQLSGNGLTAAQRQANITAHVRQRHVAERYDWAQALGVFIGTPDWSYSEGPHDSYTVNLTTPTDPSGLRTPLITAFARAITPAHLQLVVNGNYGGFLVGISRVGIDPV